ncbi:MAG: hypothetical protein RL021_1673 [Bacteroidota bacterium]|jgi:hypothetical protein
MEFPILPQTHLYEIQQRFNKRFPYLKIEFLGRPRVDGQPGVIDPIHTVVDLEPHVRATSLLITATMTTGQVEELFREKTGLNAEVFRKSGRVWLRTTVTDYRTLQEQNQMGSDAEAPERETREPIDYHEQE